MQQVADVGCVCFPDIVGSDDPCGDGNVLQQLGSAGSRHYHCFHSDGVFLHDEVLLCLLGSQSAGLCDVADIGCLEGVAFVVGEAQAVVPLCVGGHSDGFLFFYEHGGSGQRLVVRIDHLACDDALCRGGQSEQESRQCIESGQYFSHSRIIVIGTLFQADISIQMSCVL